MRRSLRQDMHANREALAAGVPWAVVVAALVVVAVVALAVGALRGQPPAEAMPQQSAAPTRTLATPASASPVVQAGTVEVPDVLGMREVDAQVMLAAAGLKTIIRQTDATSAASAAKLVVESQAPAAGVLVASGARVTLTIGTHNPKAAAASRGGAAAKRRFVVCIDPGHQERGDTSPEPVGPGAEEVKPRVTGGTTGVKTRIPEYEIALQISMNLKARLEARGVRVVMTRTTNDVNLSNAERAKIANDADADVFVRIHGDGSPDQDMSGISTLYPRPNRWTRPFASASRRAARLVQVSAVRTTGAVNCGAKSRGDLSGFNWARMPSILVECGFLSNPVEDRLLASPHYQDKVATGIADGVMAFLGESGQ